MASISSSAWSVGKGILCFLALNTIISPYVADWNATHIYNPNWPPHAKFHNAQTMVLGTLLGLLSLYCLLFRAKTNPLERLSEAVILGVLYWVAQIFSIFFPGTKLVDSNDHSGFPHVMGIEINQLTIAVAVVIPLNILAFLLERKRLRQII